MGYPISKTDRIIIMFKTHKYLLDEKYYGNIVIK